METCEKETQPIRGLLPANGKCVETSDRALVVGTKSHWLKSPFHFTWGLIIIRKISHVIVGQRRHSLLARTESVSPFTLLAIMFLMS